MDNLMTSLSIKAVMAGFIIAATFINPVDAETIQQRFQKAVIAKNCEQIQLLLPKLLRENAIYFNDISLF